MNYRHIYHAGNFADVFKHCTLILLIQALCKKEKAFCYMDTHAGIGRYDLLSEGAQKTQEYENGIARLYLKDDCPSVIKTYQSIIHGINDLDEQWDLPFPHFYPGSPLLVKSLLRPQDHAIFIELHPDDVTTLKREFYRDKQATIHHQDGYQAMKAFLPPKEKRGLVLIDPPFESQDEFYNIVQAMELALRKFQNGIYAIWYPMKDVTKTDWFYRKLKKLNCSNIFITEFYMPGSVAMQGLSRCGMAIVNAPWQFDTELEKILPWISQTLFLGKEKQYRTQWLIQPS